MKNTIVGGGFDRFASDTAPTLRFTRLRAGYATSDVASARPGLTGPGAAIRSTPSFDPHPGLGSFRTP